MVDRQKVEAILTRRFPGCGHQQVAATANAIMGLEEEWEEIVDPCHYLGCHSAPSSDVCLLAQKLDHAAELRLFRRRGA